MNRVVLVVPDAGPLISLGKADALRLLLKLELPVYVVDQILSEATQDKRFADARRIEAFVRDHPDVVHIFETEVGKAASQRRAMGGAATRQKGQGEAAIAEFLARLDEVASADDPVLLLYEDSDVLRGRFISVPSNVHIVTTKALLVGMERRGLIASAEAVWRAIASAGRTPANVEVDQPATTVRGESKW